MTDKLVTSRVKKQHLLDQYDVDNKNPLGSGAYGKVFKATNKKDNKIQRAIKAVKKSGLSTDELMLLHRELAILSKLDNPNIARYYENFEDDNFLYICMELCQGGDMHQRMEQ